jgi:tetratricopeptide (TPR) repeat protein
VRRGLLVLAIAAVTAAAQERPTDFGAWYLKTFGPPKAADAALVERAHRVFQEVASVADQRSGRTPRLQVVDKEGTVEAQALPDGTIVVNPALLRFCLAPGRLPAAKGDARLAFVLGHEMAHLAYDDSWHAEAFAAVRRFGDPELARVTGAWAADGVAGRQAKETRADRSGFLFLMMAGYDPDGVVDAGSGFLEEWARERDPDFTERARVLRAQLTSLQSALPFYRFGVRLLTLGRVDDAIRLLERFARELPSREVEANLGLAYFQRGANRLLRCGGRGVLRYRLITAVDPDSLAERLSLRGSPPAACVTAAGDDFELAKRLLTSAHEADPAHLAARLNLAAVLVAQDDGLTAYRVASDPAARDPRLAVASAVALHLAGRELRTDSTDTALRALEQVEARLGPHDRDVRAAIAFNRARISAERGRAAAAQQLWAAFLALEASGPWADEARGAIQNAGGTPAARPSPRARADQRPLRDRLPATVQAALTRASRQPFTLGDMQGTFLEGQGVSALELGGTLEVVELTLTPAIPQGRLGREAEDVAVVRQGRSDRRTLVADGVAWDLRGDQATLKVLFEVR